MHSSEARVERFCSKIAYVNFSFVTYDGDWIASVGQCWTHWSWDKWIFWLNDTEQFIWIKLGELKSHVRNKKNNKPIKTTEIYSDVTERRIIAYWRRNL